MKKVSLVFPVYQNEQSLELLYERAIAALEHRFDELGLEFIFVNDGSSDKSLEVLLALKEKTKDSRIRIVNLSRNFGQTGATIAGLKASTGDAVIYLAADLQDPPEQCVPMIQEWLAGYDIVISYRISHGTSKFNKLTSKWFYRMILPEAPKGGFDFILQSRKALNSFLSLKERNRFGQYDLLWIGFKKAYLPYDKEKRPFGKSQNGFLKRLSDFKTALLNTSYLPLRLMTLTGFGFAFSGFIYAALIVYGYFVYSTPFKGWAPIMILLLFIGGLIMMSLGILGEYVWRILDEVKGRPIYIVEDEY